MNVNYVSLILGVLRDMRVIGTVVVALIIIEFAKFITSYKKRPPRPKVKKAPAKPAAAPAPAPEKKEGEEAAAPAEGGGEKK